MKKILLTVAMLIAMASTCFAALSTNVCDFEAGTFVQNYNSLVKLSGLSKKTAINEELIFTKVNAGVENIILPLKNFKNGEGTVIALVIDQQGYIWEIDLQNSKKKTSEEMANAFAATLAVVGLEQDEITDIAIELDKNGVVEKFIPSINRTLKIESDAFKNDGVGRIEIFAYTD